MAVLPFVNGILCHLKENIPIVLSYFPSPFPSSLRRWVYNVLVGPNMDLEEIHLAGAKSKKPEEGSATITSDAPKGGWG